MKLLIQPINLLVLCIHLLYRALMIQLSSFNLDFKWLYPFGELLFLFDPYSLIILWATHYFPFLLLEVIPQTTQFRIQSLPLTFQLNLPFIILPNLLLIEALLNLESLLQGGYGRRQILPPLIDLPQLPYLLPQHPLDLLLRLPRGFDLLIHLRYCFRPCLGLLPSLTLCPTFSLVFPSLQLQSFHFENFHGVFGSFQFPLYSFVLSHQLDLFVCFQCELRFYCVELHPQALHFTEVGLFLDL